ncbi:hypothetical protein C8Q75DRAFT_865053 [Abortiporus biennis]|nr:hypothetical protein C8Q75DRAFT_865053 [Abortiporus biennis]
MIMTASDHSAMFATDSFKPSKRRKIQSQEGPLSDSIPKPQFASQLITCAVCRRTTLGSCIKCPRCQSTTCMICSRTCDGWPDGGSRRSPTPCSRSPKRPPLNVTQVNSTTITQTSSVSKRRKHDDDDNYEDENLATSHSLFPIDLSYHDPRHISGCGKAVCRNCAIENPISHTNLCLDCYESSGVKQLGLNQNQDYGAVTSSFNSSNHDGDDQELVDSVISLDP